jgi:succinate dehydrogenase/fumarate reductase-like Fe-S protein
VTNSAAPRAVLRVRRGGPGEETRVDTFEVPYREGMSVLDGLRWVRAHVDSTLALRYSCINANVCKTCMAVVDGEVKYMCLARLKPMPTTVEPLQSRPLIRDLVTDIVPAEEHLAPPATAAVPDGS